MVSEPDPYRILGVERGATQPQIRAAYLALVARFHPDRHQGNPLEELAEERLAQINRAYETLSDPGRRAAYDGGAGAAAQSVDGGSPSRGGGVARALQLVLLMLGLSAALRLGPGLLRVLFARPAIAAIALTALAVILLYRRRRGPRR